MVVVGNATMRDLFFNLMSSRSGNGPTNRWSNMSTLRDRGRQPHSRNKYTGWGF